MRTAFKHFLFWVGLAVALLILHYFFSRILALPVGILITGALVITWLLPRPWRWLLPLAVMGEMVAITPPLVLTLALLSPLILFWLRGRIEADISFSYLILVGTSAALSLALVIGPSVYPYWMALPWIIVVRGWLAITLIAGGASIILPSAHSHFFHGRYF